MDRPADALSTAYTVGPHGLELATGGGGTNPIRGISELPSVDAPAIDSYGLANFSGGNKGLRIRGEVSQHGNSIGLVEGLPISFANPGPGATWLIDNENLRTLKLYQGPIPSDVNTIFSVGGAFDSQLRWPESRMGGEISQGVGSSSFLRSFARVDSGEILNGAAKVFASGSWTDAHQWRGVGKDPQGKSGFAVGIDTRPADWFEAKVFAAKSSLNENSFAGLNYSQASNLSAYRWYNFLPVSSPNAAVAVNYAGYNIQSFDMWTTLGEFTARLNDVTKIVIKPYYFREDGYYLDGMNNGAIRKWIFAHDNWGLTNELQTRFAQTDLKIGYWRGTQNLPAPPTAWETFKPNALGGLISPTWPILANQTNPHGFDSVYGLATRDFGALHAQAGARYVWEHMPGINADISTGIGDVTYQTALELAPGFYPSRSVTGFTIGTFLPYGALAYDLTKDLTLKLSGGEGYGGPGYDMFTVYQQNFAALAAKKLTADQLWHSIRPETSTMVDFGARYSFTGNYGSGFLEPTGYYSRNHNKLVSYDSGIGVQFGQNVGESESYGFQAMGRYSPLPTIDLFASLGFQREAFVTDLPGFPGAPFATLLSLRVTGRQLPDVPYWISTVGADLHAGEFGFTPILHIVGSRAGDTSGFQPLAGYSTLDLNFRYDRKIEFGTVTASLAVLNVFNTAYIGFVNNSYYQQTSSSGIYFPGAPRAVVGKLTYKF
jgi:iron complex outermembrane recepter protein